MRVGAFIVAASMASAAASGALAQAPEPGQTARPDVAAERTVERDAAGVGLVASDAVTGIDARDHQGENIGTIDRLIINHQTGQVEHVIVASGGFLGVGRDHVLLSWSDVELMRDNESIIARVDRNVAARAPEVDRNWADRTWESATRTDRGIAATPESRQEPGIGRDPDTRPAPTTGRTDTAPVADANLISENRIVNAQVRSQDGRDIGRVERLMIAPRDGKVRYAVIGTGGFLGIGRDHLLVPFDNVQLGRDNGDVVITMDQHVIDEAPRSWFGDGPDVRSPRDDRTRPTEQAPQQPQR
jgi:sporulation protein YlmC with PRC-barrel domain